MCPDETQQPIIVRAAKELMNGIDAVPAATHRSGNYLVDQALWCLMTQVWQIARIEEDRAAAGDSRIRPAEDLLAEIATRHGFERWLTK